MAAQQLLVRRDDRLQKMLFVTRPFPSVPPDACAYLLQIPGDMAATDLVKSLNNRGRAYAKLNKMDLADIDASEVFFQTKSQQHSRKDCHLRYV